MRITKKLFGPCLLLACWCGAPDESHAQQSVSTPAPVKRSAPTTAKPASAATTKAKDGVQVPAGNSKQPGTGAPNSPAPAQGAKAETGAEELIEQGKALYKAGKIPQALAKFEAALKLEPELDEALGLAAVTAYRLDDQAKARTWFLQRAELPNQKDSIRAYCFYRTALSFWRDAHDEIAMYGTYKDGQTVFELPEKSQALAEEQITSGLYYAERALNITSKYAEAHNLKNLLHTEWRLIAGEDKQAQEQRRLAVASLKQALALTRSKDPTLLAADFGTPTVIVGEFAPTEAEEERVAETPAKLITGGEVVKRVAAVFPSSRSARIADPNDPAASGGHSLGGARGALTAAYAPGKVKVEVLISTSGEVVFAHVVQGRSDLNGAAVIAARKWKFTPAKFEGQPVQLSGVITFDMRPGRASATTSTSQASKP